MKQNIAYVFPNISTFNRNGRGGLHKRHEIAKTHGCNFVEVPADFIKNKTEVQLTGKELGSILSAHDVKEIYESGAPSENVKYILHTEPQLSRRNGKESSHTPQLQWHDEKWVHDFVNMVLAISKRFGIPPAGIEIHPGGKHNTCKDLVRSITTIRDKFERSFRVNPFIVLENRTGQFVSNGEQINDFWQTLLSENRELRQNVGVVLDIQQLFTVTKKDFLKQLSHIPHESVKGLHIHCKHRTPSVGNKIPWLKVFAWIRRIEHKIFINPEVHHHSQAKETILFCDAMMGKAQKNQVVAKETTRLLDLNNKTTSLDNNST
ncbi:MAG: hypothetical protein M0036_20920 [Desulfobacteraceae bacterium]|nr:hypothetical protein [Desulfobacteraceae bacterium]